MTSPEDPGRGFIVNNILYFIHGSMKFDNEANIIRQCESFYSLTDIGKAKDVLFDAIKSLKCMTGVKNPQRQTRNDAAAKKVLDDILFLLKKCDNEGEEIPPFFSSDFSDIPRSESPEGLVTKINALALIVQQMQSKFVTNDSLKENFLSFRQEISAQNVKSFANVVSSEIVSNSLGLLLPSDELSSTHLASPAPATAEVDTDNGVLVFQGLKSPHRSRRKSTESRPTRDPPRPTKDQPRPGKDQRSRGSSKSRIVIGQKVSSGLLSFRGVDRTVTKYIGHVDNSTPIDVIRSWVQEGNVDVIDMEELARRHSHWKSFKITVKQADVKTIEDPMFWPGGVVIRPFFRARTNNNDSTQAGEKKDGVQPLPTTANGKESSDLTIKAST